MSYKIAEKISKQLEQTIKASWKGCIKDMNNK